MLYLIANHTLHAHDCLEPPSRRPVNLTVGSVVDLCRGYLPPEDASEGQFTDKFDVYSYGVLVLEIVSGRKSIEYNQPSEQVFLVNWVSTLGKSALIDHLSQIRRRLI